MKFTPTLRSLFLMFGIGLSGVAVADTTIALLPRLPEALAKWQDFLDLMLAKLPPARPADATALLACLREFS